MSISSLVLGLWQFPFIRDWWEIRKSEIPLSKFCSISGDWDKLRIPNLAWTFLIKCQWILQNARVTAFTVFRIIKGKPTGRGVKLPPPPSPSQIRVKIPLTKVTATNEFLKFSLSHRVPQKIYESCLPRNGLRKHMEALFWWVFITYHKGAISSFWF